jgi:hypothetical protein
MLNVLPLCLVVNAQIIEDMETVFHLILPVLTSDM